LLILRANFAEAEIKTVVLENREITVTIAPQLGGKIISLKNKDKEEITIFDLEDFGTGLAKERLWGTNSWEFAQLPYTIDKQTKNSVTLKVKGKSPPLDRIEITKTYTLPADGSFLKVEVEFRNIAPLAGEVKIIPWVHNVVKIDVDSKAQNLFYLPLKEGIYSFDPTKEENVFIHAEGNWSAFLNREKGTGLLIASLSNPTFLYSWVGKKSGTLELIFEKIDPIPQYKITYYLVPIARLDARAIKDSGLPVQLTPPLPINETELVFKKAAVLDFDKVSEYYTPVEKTEEIAVRYWPSKMYLSPDIIYPVYFGIKILRTGKSLPRMIFDIPEGIKLEGFCAGYWRINTEKMELLGKESVVHGGDNYTRYTFEVSPYVFNQWNHRYARLFLSSPHKQGQFKIYYYAEFEEKRSQVNNIPVEIISIPPVKIPKRFFTGINVDYNLIKHYPDYDKFLHHLGFNYLVFNYNTHPTVDSPETYFQEIKNFLGEVRKKGFSTAVMGWGYLSPPLNYEGENYEAIDVEGKRVGVFDFTARGPWIKKVAEYIKEDIKCGFDTIISDYEPYFSGERISFTERTVKMFKEYFQQKYSNLEYIEPIILAKNPGKYPQQEKVWTDFKCQHYADYLDTVIKEVKKEYPQVKIAFCTISGDSHQTIKEKYLNDHILLSSILDYNMPMIYNNVYGIMRSVQERMELLSKLTGKGNKALLIPTLTAGFWDGSYKSPPEDNKFIILEAITSGAKGYWIFPGFNGAGGLDLYSISQANNIIAEHEDLLYDGQRRDELVTVIEAKNLEFNLPVEIRPKLIFYQDKMILFLSEYSKSEIKVKLKLNLPFAYQVIDLDNNKEIDILDKRENEFIVNLKDKERAKIFLLKSVSGQSLPADYKLEETSVSKSESGTKIEKDLVFSDSFEGSTVGKNATEGHFFSIVGGKEGQGLKFSDYQASWKYEKEIPLNSGNVTVDFWWQSGINIGDRNINLLTLYLNNDNYHVLSFVKGDSRLRLIEHRKDYPGRWVWDNALYSKMDKWGTNLWYHIRVSIGKDGLKMVVNGTEEARTDAPRVTLLPVEKITNLYLGTEWCSYGKFDELKVYDH